MESVSLENLIKQQIFKLRNGTIDKRVISFTDYQNQFTILKSKIIVEIALKDGIVAKVDISDYFKEELK